MRLFFLLCLLLPMLAFAQYESGEDIPYEELWKGYKKCDKEQVHSTNGRLNVLQRKAEKDHDEYQLFKVVYHRALLNNNHNSSWSYTQSLLYLDSMKKQLNFTNPSYNGLIDYMIAELLDEYRIRNYSKLQHADLGLTDFHTLDQWSQSEVENTSVKYYENAFSLMSQDGSLKYYDFDFMYRDTAFYAMLPCENIGLYDVILLDLLYRNDCPATTKEKLLEQALSIHHLPKDLDIIIEYELLKAFEKIEDFTLPLDSNRHWRQLMALEAKYGEHYALTYTKGILCYCIAHYAKHQDSEILPKALNFFEETLQKSHSKYYSHNARNYQEQIKDRYIYSHIIQEDYMPSARIMLPISYKNIDTLYVTIIKTKTFRRASYKYYEDNSLRTDNLTGKGCKQLRRQSFDLSHSTPNTYHTTDLFLDSLPTGNYVLLFHTEPEWDSSNVMMTKSIKVTHAHLSVNYLIYNRSVFTATDRQTGEPLRHKWLNLDHNLDVYTTDKHGQVLIKRYLYWSTPIIDFYYNKSDKYSSSYRSPSTSLRQQWYLRSYSPPSKFRELVLDRGIYRPGQSVHFKYICFEKGKTVPNRQIMAVLHGPKGQYSDTLRLVTNKFGSAASSFKLPANLIGKYHIGICEVGNNNKVYYDYDYHYDYQYKGCEYFEVAEYKLPTFTVTLEDCTKEVCQGDTLPIRGQVVSLAGAPLSDATVNIKLSFGSQYRSYTVFCDEKGCFEYPFVTLKNSEFDKPRGISYSKDNSNDYELKVEALATDVNGETQRAEKTYMIPERALNIRFEGCKSIDQCANSSIQWQIHVENVQQKVLSTPVYVRVTHLRQPTEYRECIFSTSYQQPTDPLYSKEEYKRYFPEYSFNPKVNDRNSWLVLDTVYQLCQSFDENPLLQIPISDWQKGSYKVEVKAYDNHHREEIVVKHFDIYRTDQHVSGRYEPVWVELSDTTALGDSLSVMVGTSLPNAVVLCEVYQGFKKIYTGELRLDNEYKTIKVPSKKKGHYQVNVSVQVVKNGFLYTDEDQTELVHPPVPDIVPQGLEINLTHWNNKLEPGAQEHWEVQIKDTSSTDTKTSELLTWMVDGSIYEISKERAFDGIPPMFPKFKFPAKVRPITGSLSVGSINHTDVAQTRPSRGIHPYGNFSEVYHGSVLQQFTYFISDNTVSARRVTPGRSVSSALSSLEGVSSVDGNMTAVRGNRSDGAVIIVDGVRLDGGMLEETVTYKKIVAVKDESKGPVSLNNSFESARNSSLSSSDFVFDKNIRFRSDFKETAFFYPQLESDTLGRVSIDFKLPDQYTRWHFYALAHAENGRSGWLTRQIESSRSLMIQSNAPRFLREADTMLFQIKITNLSDTVMEGKAIVRFFSMADDSPLDILVRQRDSLQDFRCQAHGTQSVAWQIVVPKGVEAVGYRVLAQAGHYGDGEENALPVLPNRTLMTETMHFFVPAQQNQIFTFQRFKQADSPTLEHYSFSVEACTNPVWNVMLSLPYLIRYRYECNEQIFSRVYANALAAHIIKLYPSVGELCRQWRNDTINHPLYSDLDKNQQFKDILLEESPWLMEAKNERSQRKNIAALYEEERLERQVNAQLRKLLNRQLAQGGWDWYGCQYFSQFVTNHIVAGCGKMERMGIWIPEMHYAMKRAIAAMDKAQSKAFEHYCEEKAKYGNAVFPFSETDVQYLYARSFFDCDTQWLACPYVQNLIKWAVGNVNQATYTRRAEVALFLFRIGRKQEAENIMEGLRQQAVRSDDLGMYWKSKESTFFYYYPWYEAPIERHALIMEAFYEISPVPEELAAMKQWLLMQKNQTHWSNTLATTNAVYAIMLGETAEQLQPSDTRISLGNAVFGSTNNQTSDGGNVYFRHTWVKDEITPELAEIKVETDSVHSTYGACYWQYFEDMDKVTAAANGLRIERKICHIIDNGEGRRIEEVTAENPVRIGEKILVRLVVATDRDLEYVHVKDLRAAAFEPVDVHERNERVNGLSYVVSSRDAATNFFFKRLPTGTYVLEYELLATQKGVFSNGVATVECMYAPEYRAQSDGGSVQVTE